MTDITTARQRHRDEFAFVLLTAYPNPDDPTRRQVDPQLGAWWPGTEPSPSEQAGRPVGLELADLLEASTEIADRRRRLRVAWQTPTVEEG